jgi:hypothetical protein
MKYNLVHQFSWISKNSCFMRKVNYHNPNIMKMINLEGLFTFSLDYNNIALFQISFLFNLISAKTNQRNENNWEI